ncbi:serine hydrolase domain-containing protein [Erythrobacter sp. HA6-11]
MNSDQFAATVERADLPGAAGIVVNSNDMLFEEAVGLADAANGTTMTLDTPCQIASMTKALISVAAMQLVERGVLELDAPIEQHLPELANPQVLTGFDADGTPQTRDAVRSITLRHLLTHTSGLGYPFVQMDVLKYFMATGMPEPGQKKAITMPLLFDPGEEWAYGVSTDWMGLAIEAATGERLRNYLQANVLEPLGMNSTGFFDAPPEGLAAVHKRLPDGGFTTLPLFLGGGEFDSGGAGLVSTARDYARFLQAMLRGGELAGARILSADTVTEMGRNQIGDLRAGRMDTTMPDLASAFDPIPDQHTGWGLGFLVNPETGPNGRAAGSMAWAGIFNSYYWIDPASDRAGLFLTQLSPFGDAGALDAFAALEKSAYAGN